MSTLDTDWHTIQTAAPGLAPQGLNDPIQSFRVRRLGHTILLDVDGLRLHAVKPNGDPKVGMAHLGRLPKWAIPASKQPILWVNDHTTSLHPSQLGIHRGVSLYWLGQIVRGQLSVIRPAELHGGAEYTTLAPPPKTDDEKEISRWMP